MKNKIAGFSLIEILVVVSIVTILVSVGFAQFSKGSAQSRDAERKADLRNLQSAIELYKNKNGRYPAGCNGPDQWSGQIGSGYSCGGTDDNSQYIVGHAVNINFSPEFIRVLPTDPKLNSAVAKSGYFYITNTDGTVYKMMVGQTVESEVVDQKNELKSCDTANNVFGLFGLCDALISTGSIALNCNYNEFPFMYSYGVWGGYASPGVPVGTINYDKNTEDYTEDVVCTMP